MSNKLLIPTFATLIDLQRDDKLFKAGLCVNQSSYADLNTISHTFLHSQEQYYLNDLPYEKRRLSYLLGRFCAKQAIQLCIPIQDLTSISIEKGIFHQPIVYYSQCHNIQVSISHTDSVGVAVAFPEAHPMSVDVETICLDQIPILKTQLTIAEQRLLDTYVTSQAVQWTLLWTAKEALSKILKCGLMVPFDVLEISKSVADQYYMISYFKNFPQYQALSFQFSNKACSLVYPKNTYLSSNIVESIQKVFFQKGGRTLL